MKWYSSLFFYRFIYEKVQHAGKEIKAICPDAPGFFNYKKPDSSKAFFERFSEQWNVIIIIELRSW